MLRTPFLLRDNSAALAIALLASACANGPDPLVGTWKLASATCDGGTTNLSSVGTFTLTYGSDGSFSAKITPPSGSCSIQVTGTWTRSGLDVTEQQAQINCGSTTCNSAIVPACATQSGVINATFSHTYRANVPSDQMEQIKSNSNTVCASRQVEVEDYQRQ